MKVIAAEGLQVPREEDPKTYIDDQKAVEVDITQYYLRRLASGELVEVDDSLPAAKVARKVKTQ